jgi:hypothetical protein
VDGLTLLDIATIIQTVVAGTTLRLVGKQLDHLLQNNMVKLVEVLVVSMPLILIINCLTTSGAGAQDEAQELGTQIDHRLITDTQSMLDNRGKLVTSGN